MMFFVITIMLTFSGGEQLTREYKLKSFDDTWACWEFITDHKVELLAPHLIADMEKKYDEKYRYSCSYHSRYVVGF